MSNREALHRIIDSMDEAEIKGFYALAKRISNRQSGELWNSLTEEQKEELCLAYDESHNDDNLISHEEAKKQHSKWLKQ